MNRGGARILRVAEYRKIDGALFDSAREEAIPDTAGGLETLINLRRGEEKKSEERAKVGGRLIKYTRAKPCRSY